MLGFFQTTTLRQTVPATAPVIAEHLQSVPLIRQWAWPQQYPMDVLRLCPGLTFTSYLGPLAIGHRVETATDSELRMVLWGAVDGFSVWQWGEGWLTQTTTGITVIPLQLGQRQLLNQLVRFLQTKSAQPNRLESLN
ncbi:hypothetical protein [Candidatus Cyanaurora vandensis]|uniref:hypothetical protein n=1 Tax=Candidatus Cyanaurora vandensis TaxID=2714958 RepID=UPI0025799C5B|nr:hypothetical protein [Candidatus Cyanaurora vandensis]